MRKCEGDESAFPEGVNGNDCGLTKREYMATAIMAGLLSPQQRAGDPWSFHAMQAVAAADALIAALNEGQ